MALADHAATVGNGIINIDPELLETCFLEYGLGPFANLFRDYPDKCIALSYVVLCFIPSTINSRCRLLVSLKIKLKDDLVAYAITANRLLECENDSNILADSKLYDSYYIVAAKYLSCGNTNARMHCIAIISKLAAIDYLPMKSFLGTMKELAYDYNWEIKTQIIIFCANLLENMNSPHGLTEEQKEDEKSFDIPKVTEQIFEIIDICFNQESPHLTKKVGLIYLSKIIKHYLDFSRKYLTILLNVSPEIRNVVLSKAKLEGVEETEYYTKSCYSMKYLTYGATLYWYPLYIAQNLQNVIIDSKIGSPEFVHIQVFNGCLCKGLRMMRYPNGRKYSKNSRNTFS